jgi:hypothetical protein
VQQSREELENNVNNVSTGIPASINAYQAPPVAKEPSPWHGKINNLTTPQALGSSRCRAALFGLQGSEPRNSVSKLCIRHPVTHSASPLQQSTRLVTLVSSCQRLVASHRYLSRSDRPPLLLFPVRCHWFQSPNHGIVNVTQGLT